MGSSNSERCWEVISRLTNVHTLSLDCFDSAFTAPQIELFTTQFSQVTSLFIETSAFRNTNDFVACVGTFPAVHTLGFMSVWFWEYPEEQPPLPDPVPGTNIRRIVVNSVGSECTDSICPWLSKLPFETFHDVELVCKVVPGTTLAALLSALGKSLTKLYMEELPESSDMPGDPYEPTLIKNTELRSIGVGGTKMPGPPPIRGPNSFRIFAPMFTTINSKHFSQLKFQWDLDENDTYFRDYFELDRLLKDGGALSSQSSLPSLVFSLQSKDEVESQEAGRITKDFQDSMPYATARGALSVIFGLHSSIIDSRNFAMMRRSMELEMWVESL